jgi:hypothetical protein
MQGNNNSSRAYCVLEEASNQVLVDLLGNDQWSLRGRLEGQLIVGCMCMECVLVETCGALRRWKKMEGRVALCCVALTMMRRHLN